MKRHVLVSITLAGVLLLFTACEPAPPPPPPTPPPPPEPTAEELYSQLRGVLGDLLTPGAAAPDDFSVEGIISSVQGRQMQLSATENGRTAIQRITRDVDEAIRTARDEERFRKVKALCQVHRVLQPGNDRYAKVEEHAQMMLDRPEITVTGFAESAGELYVFISLRDPKTGETVSYQRREGEEFHDVMRLVRIIGNLQAVEVEYLPARYVWRVSGPRERVRSGQ